MPESPPKVAIIQISDNSVNLFSENMLVTDFVKHANSLVQHFKDQLLFIKILNPSLSADTFKNMGFFELEALIASSVKKIKPEAPKEKYLEVIRDFFISSTKAKYFRGEHEKIFFRITEDEPMAQYFTENARFYGKQPNECPFYVGYTSYEKDITGNYKVYVPYPKLVPITESEYKAAFTEFADNFYNWIYPKLIFSNL